MPGPALESTLPNILAFTTTFERGSFTAAAKVLHVTPAAVSRSIARLERALATTLFRRTTRQLRPTDKGSAYYAKCRAAVELLAEAERDVAERVSTPKGKVRISVPTTYGAHRLLPQLDLFRAQHPAIELEFHVSNHNVDFVREGFDLAVRMGPVQAAQLVARSLGDFPLGVFASPRYLERRGAPRTLEDLEVHERIAFVMPRTGRTLPWSFAAPTREHAPGGAVRCVEDPRAAVDLARIGGGLFQTYRFLVERELAAGTLVEVLAQHAGRTRRFSLVYPKQPPPTKAARAVIQAALAGALAATRR